MLVRATTVEHLFDPPPRLPSRRSLARAREYSHPSLKCRLEGFTISEHLAHETFTFGNHTLRVPIEPPIAGSTHPADYGKGYGYPVSAPVSIKMAGSMHTVRPARPVRTSERSSMTRPLTTEEAIRAARPIPTIASGLLHPMTPAMLLAERRAASKAMQSLDGTNPNSGKRKASRLPNEPRPAPKRGALRSSVTVIRVDPDTLRRSRAGGRNVSERVLDGGTVVARGVKSRQTLRKLAAQA